MVVRGVRVAMGEKLCTGGGAVITRDGVVVGMHGVVVCCWYMLIQNCVNNVFDTAISSLERAYLSTSHGRGGAEERDVSIRSA